MIIMKWGQRGIYSPGWLSAYALIIKLSRQKMDVFAYLKNEFLTCKNKVL